ncbi:hypothetical protein C8F04DRAFT_1318032 [Mycena alexandri]|uniref:Uncharacterized protein n=1 Tax=Mycena alexandri TaxID=1745969 RepID=A0AAD6S3M8_9AGAR|nr:hypothetical protein C8F04DRAFT_1318032 [Mycena alexandri]
MANMLCGGPKGSRGTFAERTRVGQEPVGDGTWHGMPFVPRIAVTWLVSLFLPDHKGKRRIRNEESHHDPLSTHPSRGGVGRVSLSDNKGSASREKTTGRVGRAVWWTEGGKKPVAGDFKLAERQEQIAERHRKNLCNKSGIETADTIQRELGRPFRGRKNFKGAVNIIPGRDCPRSQHEVKKCQESKLVFDEKILRDAFSFRSVNPPSSRLRLWLVKGKKQDISPGMQENKPP